MDQLRQCPTIPHHQYSSHLNACDECQLAKSFPTQSVQSAAPQNPAPSVASVTAGTNSAAGVAGNLGSLGNPQNTVNQGGGTNHIIPSWLGWVGAGAALCFTLFVLQSVIGWMNPGRSPGQPGPPVTATPTAPGMGSAQEANPESLPKTEVPNVLRKTLEESREAIEAAGLVFKQSSAEIESEYDKGKVADQTPTSGTAASRGEEVTVTLSKGPKIELVSVPSLSGMDAKQAETAVKSAQMVFKAEDVLSDRPSGEFISQIPAAGQQVPAGSEVTASYSKGPRPPNSEELSYLATASQILTRYNRQTKENGIEVASELQKLSSQRPTVPTPENLAPFANLMERQHDQTRTVITEFEGLEPPPRYRDLHQAIMEYAGASAEVLKEAEESLRRADRGGLRQIERSGAQIEQEWKPKLSSLVEAAGLSAPKFQETGELVPI